MSKDDNTKQKMHEVAKRSTLKKQLIQNLRQN